MLRCMSDLAEAWLTLVEEDKADEVAGKAFIPLIKLDSGCDYGLAEGPTWARSDGTTLTVFSADTVRAFVEVFEHPRREFEDRVEKRAGEVGLPATEAAWSFPALQLVRAMLAEETAYFVRLALLWLLPTELREMRADIQAVSEREEMPQALRDLAVHLCVPER